MMLRLNIFSLITFFILSLSLQAIAVATEDVNIKLVGKKFPKFNLKVLGDREKKLSENILSGQTKVVHFWSKNDELSSQQQKILSMISALGIIIVGINVEGKLSKNTNLPYNVCLNDKKGVLAKTLGIKKKLPATFITDNKGIIRYQISNSLSGDSWGEEIETAYKKTIINLELEKDTGF